MPQSPRDEEFSAFVAERPIELLRSACLLTAGDTHLIYQDTHGHWVVIQAPTSLGWDDTQLAQFAAGVQVLHNARPGHG